MKTDTKKFGFVITYFQHSEDGYDILLDCIKKLSKENFYLVLASHSPVNKEVQEMCDYYIYQQKNIVDDRKFSHGVAESNLIEFGFNHLKEQGIEWTFKICYDIRITDISRFYDWINDYKYNFVSCHWGHNVICTHSFFGNVNFVLDNIEFYRDVESMFAVNTVLENCWEKNLRDKNLLHQTFSYENKQVFFRDNILDVLGYNYYNIDFKYSPEENKFYITNNSLELETFDFKIFDYYTDLCIHSAQNFSLPKFVNIWFIPPFVENIKNSRNGFYIEVYLQDRIIRKNIFVNDFDFKHPLSKKFKTYKKLNEIKFHQFCEYENFSKYDEFNIDLDSMQNFVDLGTKCGLSSIPFLLKNKTINMFEKDSLILELIKENFGFNKNIKLSQNFDEHLIKDEHIDLMRIDIEGDEYSTFKNMTDNFINKVSNFIIEFKRNENNRIMEIIEKLTFNGFKFKFSRKYVDGFILENNEGMIYAWK